MKKALIALLIPPLAIARYGRSATWTAAPIATFWMTSLVGIAFGLQGGPLRLQGPSWPIVGLGIFMWATSTIWALLVMKGVEDDLQHHPESTLDHQVEPRLDETDPLKQVRDAR